MRIALNLLSWRNVIIYITPLIYWFFYEYIAFPTTILKITCFGYSLFLFCYTFSYITKRPSNIHDVFFKRLTLLLFVSLLIPTFFWNQSIELTFRASASAFVFLYYYVLKKTNASMKEIKFLVMFYSIVYILLWLYAYSKVPDIVFSYDERLIDRGEIFRIIIKSYDMVCLCFFVCYFEIFKNKRKIIWCLLSSVFFFFLVMGLTRMIIVTSILLTIYYLYKLISFKKRIVFTTIVFFVFSFWISNRISDIDTNPFVEMIEMTQEQFSYVNKDNSDLRIIEYQMGFFDYPRNVITFFIGNGIPHPESSYGAYEKSLHDKYKFDRSDAGYPSIIITFGLIGLITFVTYFWRVTYVRISPDMIAFKCYIVFIAIINIMQDATTWYGISICIAAYALNLCNNKKII